MKVLVLDNYDSFTYNLVHILRQNKVPHEVFRNDKINATEVSDYSHIIFSPGPGIPSEAGQMLDIIQSHLGKIPMLGICLGHQAIAESLGAQLENMEKVYHGVCTNIIKNNDSAIYKNVPFEFAAGRYHSWKVSKLNLPSEIKITAVDENGDIMSFDVLEKCAYGIQFHPESVMTPSGENMIMNFLALSI